MRTSLNEIREIERYVRGAMEETEAVMFEGRLRVDPILRINVILQRKVISLVKMYHRKRLKMQLEEVHERLVNDPLKATWHSRVLSLFHNN